MGQYYVTVNLDKGEFLNPNDFGQGLKLLEFGSDSNGLLTALALLCSNGNGNGGGDIRTDEKRHPRRAKMLKATAGRWAGDRIVVAGDYGDYGKFMTPEFLAEVQKKMLAMLPGIYQTPEIMRCYPNQEHVERAMNAEKYRLEAGEINLYKVCDYGLFENISETAFEGICADQWIREEVIERYASDEAFAPSHAPKGLLSEIAKAKQKP